MRGRLEHWLLSVLMCFVAAPLSADGTVLKEAVRVSEGALTEQRLSNGDLELVGSDDFPSWRPYQLGCDVDTNVSHKGRHSARCHNLSADEHRGLLQVVELNQSVPAPIFAECWSRADDVSPGRPGDYSLYLDLQLADGSPLWAQISPFDAGTHEWQRRTVTVVPPKPIKRVSLYCLLRSRSGTAWFDDISLFEAEFPHDIRCFDHVPVTHPVSREDTAMPGPAIQTEDGLRLDFDSARGDIFTVAPGGLFLRDVAAESDFVQPRGTLEQRPDGTILRRGRDDKLGLELSATYRVFGNAIRIDGETHDLANTDRAVTVYFTYPIDAVGWRWHDDQRTSRPVQASRKYDNFVATGAGANGLASRYPLACISSEADALALAVPLDVPRICRLGYDAESRELYAAFDLGLSPDTANFPSSATFSLVLYRCDPAWGFRSALQRYYELFPHCFTKRNAKEGIWMPFTDIATVQGFQDFGFQFKEGDDNVPFDAAHGIYSFVYVEPWSNWVSMPEDMPRTVQDAMALVKQRAAEGSQGCQATLSALLEDADGSPAVRIEDQPWCDGAVVGLNPSPALDRPGAVNQFRHLSDRVEHAFDRNPRLSGLYHDSFEMYLFPNFLNYRRDHWRKTTIPLVFDRHGRVCQFAYFNMIEFARETAERLWARGKLTFANGAPHSFPWSAAWLDVMGTEACWAPSWGAFGKYQPESDANLNYWRALCYQRPYLLLLNTRFDLWQPEWFELYMKRCTAYGVFPSFFSHNASEDPYWRNPDLYNRNRPLFKKYIPVISALSKAGWEPVTHARSDNPKVYVERFGTSPGTVYLTLFNDSHQAQQTRISLDFPQLGLSASDFQVGSLLPDSLPGASFTAGTSGLRIELAPEDVQVVALN